MSQTKYPLPEPIKAICVNLVRSHAQRVAKYQDKREIILCSSTTNQSGVFTSQTNRINRPAESRAENLERLENSEEARRIRAIEQARHGIGMDLPEKQREKLMESVWDSCVYGRNFILTHYHLPMGRSAFYERRRRFLWEIAVSLKLLDEEGE